MKREITVAILLTFFVPLVYWGSPLVFFVFASTAILLCTWEYFRMISYIGVEGYPVMGMALSFLLSICFYFEGRFLLEWLVGTVLALFSAWYLKDRDPRMALDQIAYTLIGVIWTAGTLGHFILIRNLEDGQFLSFFVFLTVWVGDTTAYYGGRKLGRHPLIPTISPKKTIEGAICGLGGSISAGFLAHFGFLQEVSLTHCLIMGLFCGIIGQFGDLAESALKRNVGVKDSGGLVPGHGGVLDRVDGLMFVGPVFYFYYKWVLVGL